MDKPTQIFRVHQDEDNTWIVQSLAGRIYARSPYKDTAIDLARLVARLRAPAMFTSIQKMAIRQKSCRIAIHVSLVSHTRAE